MIAYRSVISRHDFSHFLCIKILAEWVEAASRAAEGAEHDSSKVVFAVFMFVCVYASLGLTPFSSVFPFALFLPKQRLDPPSL